MPSVLFSFPYASVFLSSCNYPVIVGSADKTLVVLIIHFLPDDPSSPYAAAPMGDG